MNENQFDLWCRENNLSDKARSVITRIRSSQPARLVASRKNNVSGRYPSKKMGVTVQFESSTVEFPAIYMMEHDLEVLEYYDQPNTIKINYINTRQKNIGVVYTPDFFIIKKNVAIWEEWKTEEELLALSLKNPNRYHKDIKGNWRCPPAEEYASQFDLEFRIRSSKEINIKLLRNLHFLEDYMLDKDINVLHEIKDEVRKEITENYGISLFDLIKRGKTFKADDLYSLLIKREIYVDIEKYNLSDYKETPVFLNKEHAMAFQNSSKALMDYSFNFESLNLKTGKKISWEGQRWEIANIGIENIALINEEKFLVELSKPIIADLFNSGKIRGVDVLEEPIVFQEARRILLEASPEQLSIASERLNIVKNNLNKKNFVANDVSNRTLSEWKRLYDNGEKVYGNGYISLIPQTHKRGNRKNKLPVETLDLLKSFIEEEYENIKQKSRKVVYGSLLNKCELLGIVSPSYKTFCKYVKERPKEESVRRREGKRVAYKHEAFYWALDQTTPRHGDRPFEICHIDHTELDIEVVFSNSEKKSSRPYITFLVDAYSRKILAYYLTFDSPSYRSIMMVLRECVRKHSRLPQSLVVDGGKEFQSTYFETLLATYECTKKLRPAAKPRYGSVIERLFGTANTMFIHNLQGHTKIMRNVRQVTKDINPKNHAIWNLADLNKELLRWIDEVYHNLEHPAFGETPNEAFEIGISLGGTRPYRLIRYDDVFKIMTLPTTAKGYAKVQIGMGVKINYIYYWSDIFKDSSIEETKVPVRFDPFDLGIAYAFVKGNWIQCISQYYTLFKGRTENELKIISAEIRKKHVTHTKSFNINAKLIASYITEMDNLEKVKAQRIKDQSLKESLKEIKFEEHKIETNNLNEHVKKFVYSELDMFDSFEEC
ncbi:DDE-type integrase/transposase/recombinase [Priestia megaterium]|uniref:DDE-type integrase/transposase/recombinase n=1 Tax=Priestia megaterium TaxID=1404 RepID=UPI00211D3954|nr:DDE-type integrase/transposase/recombinase [Priestia megaterium]